MSIIRKIQTYWEKIKFHSKKEKRSKILCKHF